MATVAADSTVSTENTEIFRNISKFDIAKITVGSTFGTIMEWYDFFLAALAATTVWPALFFPTLNPAVGLAAAAATYAVTYFTRPIGAYIFGHYGDRIGRRTMLVWTLLIMGGAMTGIAVLPVYAAIGVLAPALLIVLRLIIGIGVGGEWGGAATWVIEFAARSKNRGFWEGWVMSATPGGLALAVGFFTLIRIYSPNLLYFVHYGWRIAFALGAVLLLVGVIVRYRLTESPIFNEQRKRGALMKSPATDVLKRHLGGILLLGLSWAYIIAFTSGLVIDTAIPLFTAMKVPLVFTDITVFLSAFAAVVGSVVGGVLGDKFGNRKTLLLSAVLSIIVTFPYFYMVQTGNHALMVIAMMIILFVPFLGFGVLGRWFTEYFEAKYRYSGSGLSYQLGAVFGSVPTVAPTLLAIAYGGYLKAWPYIGVLMVATCIISIAAALGSKEIMKLEHA